MGKIKDMKEYIGTGELMNDRRVWKAFLAEFLGTMFLVFIGCGSCIGSWNEGYAPSVVQISLAFGVTVASIAQAVGHVSGCHINPAVTCAMLVARHVSVIRALIYIVCQCLGAIVGAAILKGVTPADIQGSLGMTLRNEKIDTAQALGIELLITFVLVITVFGACDERRNDVKGSAPLAIGLSITTCHLFAVPITGSSMNPARSFGPAVISGLWQDHWIYWLGPIMGGLLAGRVYKITWPGDEEDHEEDNHKKNKRENEKNIEKEKNNEKEKSECKYDLTISIDDLNGHSYHKDHQNTGRFVSEKDDQHLMEEDEEEDMNEEEEEKKKLVDVEKVVIVKSQKKKEEEEFLEKENDSVMMERTTVI